MDLRKKSKFLSYLLRHHPDELSLSMDTAGWVDVDDLLPKLFERDSSWTREVLQRVVDENTKKRFEIVDERIRARQGHSLDVDLGLTPTPPPDVLFHGTHPKVVDAILSSGLLKMQRHHVHLSEDVATAKNVGGRRGKPVVFEVDAAAMVADGHTFFVTENGVWLVDEVAPKYLSVVED